MGEIRHVGDWRDGARYGRLPQTVPERIAMVPEGRLAHDRAHQIFDPLIWALSDHLGEARPRSRVARAKLMSITFPGESPDYRAARNRLLEREIELRRLIEAVAAERRALPPGGVVATDYTFTEVGSDGSDRSIKLSSLFARGKGSLVVYNMMFPRYSKDDRPGPSMGSTALLPLAEGPCPSCVALLDQLDGAAIHVEPKLNFVVIAKTSAERLAAFGRERGWRHLRLLSSAGTTFKRDYGGETPEGDQMPMLNVFQRDGDTIRHFWSSELLNAPSDPGQDPRHVGTLEPSWNMMDLTPEGRPEVWDEQLDYRHCH